MEDTTDILLKQADRLQNLSDTHQFQADGEERYSNMWEWYSGLALGYKLGADLLRDKAKEIGLVATLR